MLKMTPDKANGKDILRPLSHYDDGIPKLASSAVFHPPSVDIVYPHEPLGKLVEIEAKRIVSMKAMTTSELRARLFEFAKLVLENERRLKPNG
jgi:hypothetical protein